MDKFIKIKKKWIRKFR